MLLNCNDPELVLIENPLELERELLITLFDRLNKKFKLTHYQKFHIYITSRSMNITGNHKKLFSTRVAHNTQCQWFQ